MSPFFSFEGFVPVVDPSSYVHPTATVIGNVIIGKDVFVGAGAVIRGDWGGIEIEDGCNIQETCVIHMFPNVTVRLERDAHIGHGAVVHGAHIGANSLIGMNAVIMDNVVIGEGCLVGALTFVPQGMEVPPRKVVVGNPARIVKDVSDDALAWKSQGTQLYQTLPEAAKNSMRPVEPLRSLPADRPTMPTIDYGPKDS